MNAKVDWKKFFRDQYSVGDFKTLHWEGSFWDYLDVVRGNPLVSRNSFQRMYDAASALSENELNDIDRYPWLAGQRLADVITDAFGHFHEEHEPLLRDWLARIG